MAEFVQFRIEEMIPELEEMERAGIFQRNEIKAIIKRRKGFEYRFQRQAKRKEDILAYIQYENNLRELIRERQQRLGSDQQRQWEIDQTIAQRIVKMYKALTNRWKSDVNVWKEFIRFCIAMKYTTQASLAYVDMLGCHSLDPQLWIDAARYEMTEMKAVESARKLIFRGLKFHPKNKDLHEEYFALELAYLERLLGRQKVLGITSPSKSVVASETLKLETDDDQELPIERRDVVMSGELLNVAYEVAAEEVSEPAELAVACFRRTSGYPFADGVRKKILGDLEHKFTDSELAWDTRARLKLDPSHYGDVKSEIPKKSERVKNCVAIYDKALEVVDTSLMWSLYLDTISDVLLSELKQEEEGDGEPQKKKKRLKDSGPGKVERFLQACKFQVLQKAAQKGKIPARYFHELVFLLRRSDDTKAAFDALEKAKDSNLFAEHPQLWSLYLSVLLEEKQENWLQEFNRALSALAKSHVERRQLWLTVLRHRASDELYLSSIKDATFGAEMKDQYLRWVHSKGGIQPARDVYTSQAGLPPFSLDFHFTMKDIEEMESLTDSLTQIRRVFSNAVQQFGERNADVWLSYIEWENEKGDPLKTPSLHEKAMKTLPDSLAEEFLTNVTLKRVSLTQ